MISSFKVSVVIPSFNARHLLEKNLPSVFTALRDGDQVVIIEDAGKDDTVPWLRKKYHLDEQPRTNINFQTYHGQIQKIDILVIENVSNLRFGASCNRAVSLASGDLIWLLNNDVVPEPQVLEYILPHFLDKQMFAVGCHEIQSHDALKSAGKAQLWFEKGLFRHQAAREMTTGPSDWVNGGSSFFSKEKWEVLEGFDHDYYPAYWEDIDLCFRAQKQGWKIWFEAKAVVHHHHETTNQSIFGQRIIDSMSWRNGLVFTWKNSSWWQKIQFIIWQPYWWVKRQRYQTHQSK